LIFVFIILQLTYIWSTSFASGLDRYYAFIASIRDSSVDYHTNKLGKYVSDHPDLERAYLKLLEHYLFIGEVSKAKRYFKKLAVNQESKRNSFWMLAKLSMIQDSSEAAFYAFSKALGTGTPSPLLLNDVVEFYHSESKDSISDIHLAKYHSKIVSALLDIKNQRLKEAQIKFQDLPDSLAQNGLIQYFQGATYFNLGSFNSAERIWSDALEQSRKSGDRQFEVVFQISLGALKTRQRIYSEAHTYFRSALKTSEQFDNKKLRGLVKGNLGWLNISEAKYKMALQNYDDAILLSSRIHAYDELSSWYLGKGLALFYMDKLDNVLPFYDRSEELSIKMRNEQRLALIKLKKGVLFIKLNLKDFAKHEFEAGHLHAKKIGKFRHQFDLLSEFANLYFADKEYLKSRKIYLELLESMEENARPDRLSYLNLMIGETYRLENSLEQAKERYLIANRIAEDGGSGTEYYLAYSRLRLADVKVQMQNYDAAIMTYNENIIKKFAGKSSGLKIDLNFGLGNAFKGKDELNKAITYYKKAADIIEDERKELTIEEFRTGFFSATMDVYHALIRNHLELYETTLDYSNLEKIYYFLEMSRARTLRDLRFSDDSNQTKFKKSADYLEYREACQDLQQIQRKIRDNPYFYNSLLSDLEIARHNLLYKRLQLFNNTNPRAEVEPITLEQLTKVLENLNLGLLIYHISENSSFALAANGSKIVVVRLPINTTLLNTSIDSLISPFHLVSDTSIQKTPFHAGIAHRLYEQLLKPIEEKIDLGQSLLIIPDLSITGLPFEMLLTQRTTTSEYKPSDAPEYSDHFLLNRYAIMYSPSTWLAKESADTASINPKVMLIANPFSLKFKKPDKDLLLTSRSGWRFDPLWYAEHEVEGIRDIHPNSSIFKGDGATKSILFENISAYQVVHFATHAFVDIVFDAFSGLALATSEDSLDDGLLMGYEIADLKLNCDLINLSACETGRGKIVAGEGVLGLSRLFLGAGAKRVLMTHWKVDDKFTSGLMPRFYDYFLNQKLSKAEALKEAKLALIKKNKRKALYYAHPLYWASFALYGTPGKEPQPGISLALIVIILVIMLFFSAVYFRFIRKRSSRYRKIA
jgi:CHAT domain-containing protein/Tfp pilus assembly protein PilF